MDAAKILEFINKKTMKYTEVHESLFTQLCDKTNKTGTESRFGPNYQLYTYAFFIGFYNKKRIPFASQKKKDFSHPFGQWFPSSTTLQNIMILIATTECISDFFEFQNQEETAQILQLNNLVTCIEEYANGGLEFISNGLESDEIQYDNPFKFYDILYDLAEK